MLKNGYSNFLLFLVGAVALMLPALINGYPFVYSDTSTYLASGFELETPFDRPITYGLFIRLFSFNGLTLWGVIVTQALLLTYLISRFVKIILGKDKSIWVATGVVGFIALFTGASFTVSHIMPDIFTSVTVLSMILILFGSTPKTETVFLYFIFILATAMHLSHITFNIVLMLLLLLLRSLDLGGLKKYINSRKLLLILGFSLACIGIMGSALSKSRHVFFMGALVEHGIAKTYLDEHCSNTNYKLCAYKDSLPPLAWQFIWEDNSPFYKIGGWKETKSEFNDIIRGTLTEPRFILMHITESLKATVMQLTRFKSGDGLGAFGEETLLYQRVNEYFPNEANAYSNSLQSRSKLGFITWANYLHVIIVICSALLLIMLCMKGVLKDEKMLTLLSVIVAAIAVNAWTCGTFANAIDRLGVKVIWLLPLIVAIAMVGRISNKIGDKRQQ